jgi:outer membrane protein assembly factor BamB
LGNASPIVVPVGTGARVLVLCDHGWPLGEGETPVLLCYDAESGKELWRKAIDPLDALPAAEAAPLRAARHAFWLHQHEAGRLHYRFHFEATTPEEKERIKQAAREHMPDLGSDKMVEKHFATSNKSAKMYADTAMTHPDCEPLRKQKGKPALLGVSSWNWTGIGQAMCTPISDGEAVYVVTGLRTVTKLGLDGKVLWHRFEKDVEQTKFYECRLANGLHLLATGTGGSARRLLVFECYEDLWAYDCATGQIVWKTHTSSHGGHACGTPQLLRLPDGKGEELLVVTRSGHVIRVRDGAALAENMFNVNYEGPLSDGRDRVWIKQAGGDGGHFHPLSGLVFDKKCVAGLRFRIEGGKLAYDRFFYDEQNVNRPIPNLLGFIRGNELLDKNLVRSEASTGKLIAQGPRVFRSYNGTILAGGHFYAVSQMTTVEGAPKGAKPGDPGVDARMICHVANDGTGMIDYVGARTVEIIETDPKDSAKRYQRMALTGRLYPGEWMCWHAAYVAPFAYKNRLYIRSFDNLYCFGGK